jgi:uncharacterized protein YcbX
MARVAALTVYPVKSCAGIALEAATLGIAGLETGGIGDREWMVVDAASGRFVTQREAPCMALITPAVGPSALTLAAPGHGTLDIALGDFTLRPADLAVQVWNHACRAFDEGVAAAAWLTDFLGRRVRLARFDPAHRRASNREWTGDIVALNRFSDGYPILVISQASLTDLNERLMEAGREALPMNRFRPNIVVDGVEAFDEDRCLAYTGQQWALKPVKACPRCPIPSIDQATAKRGPDPLDILARYRDDPRLGVVFGQNTVVTRGNGATIRVGDTFEPEWNF